MFSEGNLTWVVIEIPSPVQSWTNSLVSMKYLNTIDSPLVVGPYWLLLRCQWQQSAWPPLISQCYFSVHTDSRGILLCAPHNSSHHPQTITSPKHWHRLSGRLYLSYHFLISGPSFSFLSGDPQKNQFSPFLV